MSDESMIVEISCFEVWRRLSDYVDDDVEPVPLQAVHLVRNRNQVPMINGRVRLPECGCDDDDIAAAEGGNSFQLCLPLAGDLVERLQLVEIRRVDSHFLAG